MARPRKNPIETPAEPVEVAAPAVEVPAITADAAPVIRRRRRRKAANAPLINEVNDATALVSTLLRSRGMLGATPDEFHVLVSWARSIRDEGEALQGLSARPRRQKTQAPVERLTRYEMNRALLDGVIGGTIGLDVMEDASLRFVPLNLDAPSTPAETSEDEVSNDNANGVDDRETNDTY